MTTFDNENKPFLSHKYFCENCYYKTSKKSNYTTHLLSSKHIKTINNNENKTKISSKHKCEKCEKEYNDRAGLWRHKKKCTIENDKSNNVCEQFNITPEIILNVIQQNQEFKDLLIEQNKQNVELQKRNGELQKQMLEVIKNGTNNTNNNNSDSKRSDQYNCITMEAMGGAGNNDDEKANKIVKKIAKEVTIDKNM